MLREEDIQHFLNNLPPEVRQMLSIASNKEHWPQDEADEVRQAIGELSELLESVNTKVVSSSNLSAALSSMALVKLPRSLLLLDVVLSERPDFLSQIIDQPGETGKDIRHKVIMINRLMFLARTQVINEIFSEAKCEAIRQQMQRMS